MHRLHCLFTTMYYYFHREGYPVVYKPIDFHWDFSMGIHFLAFRQQRNQKSKSSNVCFRDLIVLVACQNMPAMDKS